MNAVQEKKVDYRLERLTYSQLRLLEELFGRNGRDAMIVSAKEQARNDAIDHEADAETHAENHRDS